MKSSKALWLKRIVIGTAVATLPQVLLARGPGVDNGPPPRPADFVERGAAPQPPAGMPGLPWLNGIDLTDAQQDAVFDLVHAQIPAQRTLEKKAAKVLDELHRLSADEGFNARQAHALADRYAQAQAQLVFNRSELAARLRALLTPQQRQQLDAQRPAQAGPHPANP